MSRSEIFLIKTTGCADATEGLHYYPGLLYILLNTIIPNLLSQLPQHFTQVIIQHHDILLDKEKYHINKLYFVQYLNQIIQSYEHKLDERIVHHSFTDKPLDIQQIDCPHFVIDMAHIFHYGHSKQIINNDLHKSYYFNCIYIGWNNEKFANKKLYEINQDGSVRTYIDCMFESGFNIEIIYDPVESLYVIEHKIKCILLKEWREIKGRVLTKDAGGIFDELYASFNIIDIILDKLFESKTKAQILDISTYPFYGNFNKNLSDPAIK